LNWLIAALLAVQFPICWLMPHIRQGVAPGNAMKLDITIGLVILMLIVLRLFHTVAPADALPPWQRVPFVLACHMVAAFRSNSRNP
jgi:cytochrome b561